METHPPADSHAKFSREDIKCVIRIFLNFISLLLIYFSCAQVYMVHACMGRLHGACMEVRGHHAGPRVKTQVIRLAGISLAWLEELFEHRKYG